MATVTTVRFALWAALAVALAGCAEQDGTGTDAPTPPAAGSTVCDPTIGQADASWVPQKPRVRITTSKGVFVAEIESERAPATAANFLNLTRSGFYDGTLFHRVIRDFVIQGGDPLSKDNDPSNDGTGDPGYAIPDEFHPALRHDAIGVLSMANSGPNTGGSQFFVTLAPTAHLDDRHSVFGRVVEGNEVVRSIGVVQVDGATERPLDDVRLEKAEVLEPSTYEIARGAGVHVVVGEKKAEPGRPVRYAVIAKNTGNVRDLMAVGASPPEGWQCVLDAPAVVPAGTARVLFLSLIPPASATGTISVPIHALSASGAAANTTLNVVMGKLGAQIKEGDRVTANYAGLLPDGRLFDTSMPSVAQAEGQPKFETVGGFQARPSYSTFPFTVGSGVIAGFTNLAKTAKAGETVSGYIPAADAYATGDQYQRPLTGRDLIFELEIVKVG